VTEKETGLETEGGSRNGAGSAPVSSLAPNGTVSVAVAAVATLAVAKSRAAIKSADANDFTMRP
jgi:hypothetical protein